jgi:hypothetical protein
MIYMELLESSNKSNNSRTHIHTCTYPYSQKREHGGERYKYYYYYLNYLFFFHRSQWVSQKSVSKSEQ